MRAVVLVLALGVAGCGYAKRTDMDAELARLRTEMAAADKAQAEAAAAQQAQLAQRLAALERDLASFKSDFGAKVTKLEGDLQGLVAFDVPVHFGFAQAEVQADDQAVLDRFASVVQKYYAGSVITVEGFTDASGSVSYNQRLGQKRADAVREYLMGKGIAGEQIKAVSYGEAKNRLIAPKAAGSKSGAAANRRVSLVVDSRPGATLAGAN